MREDWHEEGREPPPTPYPVELADRPLTLPRRSGAVTFALGVSGAETRTALRGAGGGHAADLLIRLGLTERLELLLPLLFTWSFSRDPEGGTEWALVAGVRQYTLFAPLDLFPSVGVAYRRQPPRYVGLRAALNARTTAPLRGTPISGAVEGSIAAIHTFGESLSVSLGAAVAASQPRPFGTPNPFQLDVQLGSSLDAPLVTFHVDEDIDLFVVGQFAPVPKRGSWLLQFGIQAFFGADRKFRGQRR